MSTDSFEPTIISSNALTTPDVSGFTQNSPNQTHDESSEAHADFVENEQDDEYEAEADEYEYAYFDEDGNEILAQDVNEEEYEFEEVEDDADVSCEDDSEEEYEDEDEYEYEYVDEDEDATVAEGDEDEYEYVDEDDDEYEEDELDESEEVAAESETEQEPALEGYALVKNLIDRQEQAIDQIDELDTRVVGMIGELTGRDEGDAQEAA